MYRKIYSSTNKTNAVGTFFLFSANLKMMKEKLLRMLSNVLMCLLLKMKRSVLSPSFV